MVGKSFVQLLSGLLVSYTDSVNPGLLYWHCRRTLFTCNCPQVEQDALRWTQNNHMWGWIRWLPGCVASQFTWLHVQPAPDPGSRYPDAHPSQEVLVEPEKLFKNLLRTIIFWVWFKYMILLPCCPSRKIWAGANISWWTRMSYSVMTDYELDIKVDPQI